MIYIKSYGKATFQLMKVLGASFLIGSVLFGSGLQNFQASILIYLCAVTGLAGPISVAINKGRT